MTPGHHHRLGGRDITKSISIYGIEHRNFLQMDVQNVCKHIRYNNDETTISDNLPNEAQKL
jgi:hypothetical protein